MTPADLIRAFETLADAPDGVTRLRELVLQLAVRGKLVPQDPSDERASELLERISAGKKQLVKAGKTWKASELTTVSADERPFQVPDGWAWVRLGAVAEFQYGKGLKAADRNESGSVPVYGSNGVVGYHDKALVLGSAIIVGRKGSAGALNLALGDSWPTDVTYFVQVPDELVLRYWLLALNSAGLQNLSAGIKPGLNRNQAAVVPVALPPLAEQHRIVARVDELMALLDHLEAARTSRDATRVAMRDGALAALRDAEDAEAVEIAWARVAERMDDLFTDPADVAPLRQTILQLAVRGRLVPQDPSDEPASALLKRVAAEKARLTAEKKLRKSDTLPPVDHDEAPFAVPATWRWTRLGAGTLSVTDGDHQAPPRANQGVAFLTIGNVSSGVMDFSETRFVPRSYYEALDGFRRPRKGDVLYTVVGATYGRPIKVDDCPDFCVQRHIAIVRPGAALTQEYLHLFLGSPIAYEQASTSKTGTAQPTVALGPLRRFCVPVPPLAEQRRIAACVDELMGGCDKLEMQLRAAQLSRAAFARAAVHHLDA